MPRVCIIIVYFGQWPSWFSAWLQSCKTNPEFNWLIFSDLQAPKDLPGNVKIEIIEQHQLEHRVSKMLGARFALSKGYKLVDLKPTYGDLFQDYLPEFDFWGYTDLDVIYGHLANFFTSELLDLYDILSPSDRLLVGHLTLIRNTQKFNNLYRECWNYQQIICRETHEGFDEKGFHSLVLEFAHAGKLRLFLRNMKQEDIILRLLGRGRFLIVWFQGRLYDSAVFHQICHFHFMESKWGAHYQVAEIGADTRCFYLTPNSLRVVDSVAAGFELAYRVFMAIVFTIPFYIKSVARRVLPRKFRLHLRKPRSNN